MDESATFLGAESFSLHGHSDQWEDRSTLGMVASQGGNGTAAVTPDIYAVWL